MKKFFEKNKLIVISAAMSFVFYTWIAMQIPYTHDDWDWGLNIGLQHLLTADINSRYAGNLIEVIITRNSMIKSVMMGVVFALIPLVATAFVSGLTNEVYKKQLTEIRQLCLFIVANIFFLTIPSEIWRETNGWIAGFSNFVTSALSLLLYYLLLMNSEKLFIKRNNYKIKFISICLFGVIIQLFIENLSIYVLICSLLFLLLKRRSAEDRKVIVPLLLGNMVGTIMMFSSNIYSQLLSTGHAVGDYRQLMYDTNKPFYIFVVKAASRYIGKFIPMIMANDGVLMGVIAGLMAAVIFTKRKTGTPIRLLGIGNILFCLYYIYSYINPVSIFDSVGVEKPFFYKGLISGTNCLFVLIITIEIILLFNGEKKFMKWLLFVWISPFFIIAPMVMINTVGPRCFYTTDICFIVFGMLVFYRFISHIKHQSLYVVFLFCAFAYLVIGIQWINIYGPIGTHMRMRDNLIKAAISNNDKLIAFPKYPNDEYLWLPDPMKEDPNRSVYFREFYKIPVDIDIWFESWNETK